MSVQLIHSRRLFPDPPYAYAAVVPAGALVFTAGACPLDEHGEVDPPGDYAGQMRRALANLAVTLEESQAVLTDVVRTTVYVASANRADLVTAWDEVAKVFGDHPAPSTLLGVSMLGYPGQLVEIEAVAAISV